MQITQFETSIENGIVHIPKQYHNLNKQKVKLIIISKEDENTWQYWNNEEIDNFGKIAIGLSKNNYDDEDYSKW